MKHTNLFDEIEVYESKTDKVVLGLTILMVAVSIALILWHPDVESIGQTIYNVIH